MSMQITSCWPKSILDSLEAVCQASTGVFVALDGYVREVKPKREKGVKNPKACGDLFCFISGVQVPLNDHQ